MSGMNILVVIETRKVKGFLMASSYIRETRGGSLLLDRLNRVEIEKLLHEQKAETYEKVYLGGGSGRVLFKEEKPAEEFAEAVRDLYERETTTASISVQVVPRKRDEGLAEWMRRGVELARWEKNAGRGTEPLLAGRWIRPCTSCGAEPAWKTRTDVHGAHSLCGACDAKRKEIQRFYQAPKHHGLLERPIPKLDHMQKKWGLSVLNTAAKELQKQKKGEQELRLRLPQDFNLIGGASTPKGYFAFLYADANQMGQVIRKLPERYGDDASLLQAYRALSEIVDQATREAAAQAVLEAVPIQREQWTPKNGAEEPMAYLPAEFVIAGGDDLILVVPAQAGLQVAWRFVELFQERILQLQKKAVESGDLDKEFAPEGLATSVGMVLSHAIFPASLLLDLAGDLLKMAKKEAARLSKKEEAPVGTVDFMVLPDSGSEGAKRRRKDEYLSKLTAGGGKVFRTERPYTAEGLKELAETVRELRQAGVPRNKLKSLYGTLFQNSHLQTQFEALRIKERLQATRALEKGPLGKLVDALPFFPFRPRSRADGTEDWTTPLSELVEAYEFIPLDKPSQGGDQADQTVQEGLS